MTTRLSLAITLTLITSSLASAQFQQPPQPVRPSYSPYLNLLRNGAPMYQNYFGLVQPQLEAQKQLNQLSQDVYGLQNAAPQNVLPGTGAELSTGKFVGFMTHRGYFLNSAGGGAGRGIGTGGQMGNTNNNANVGPMSMQGGQPNTLAPNSIMPFRR